MKEVQKICRLCSCGNGILLDLFGPGKTSYAKEINTCLSLEVKKDDGFPQNVCIKCIGQLEECSPYVNKVIEHHQKGLVGRSLKCVCYYCHSKINYLFSITDGALKQTEECFNFQVPIQAKICHRCQFYLETLFELREKSRSALAQFCADDILNIKAKEHKEDSVVDIVNNLKRKFGPKMSQTRKRKKEEEEVMEPRVQVMDVCAYMGITFFSKGTVNVKQFLQQMPSSPIFKRVRFLDNAIVAQPSGNNHKRILKNDLSSNGALSSKPGPKSSKKSIASLKLAKNICLDSPEKKTKKSSVLIDSNSVIIDSDEDSLPLKAVMGAPVSKARPKRSLRTDFASPFSASPHINKGDDSPIKESFRTSPRTKKQEKNSETKWNERNGTKKKTNNSPLNKKMKKHPSVSAVTFEKSSPVSGYKRNLCDSGKFNESDNSPRKRRKSRKAINYRELVQEGQELVSDPDDDFVDRAIEIDSDSGSDETPVANLKPGRKPNRTTPSTQKGKGYEPPEYLKALDKVLIHTPKSAFKPFICPTCHEGYVSTVKGMLHRLMAHDPRSNVSLKLSRIDERCEIPERHSQEPQEEKQESLNASNENAFEEKTNCNPSDVAEKSNEACTIDAERREKVSGIPDTGNPQQNHLLNGCNSEVFDSLNFDKEIENDEKQNSYGISFEENAVNNKIVHTSVSEIKSDGPIKHKGGEEDSDLMEKSTQPTQEQSIENEDKLGMADNIVPEKAVDNLSTEAEGNACQEVEDDTQKKAEDISEKEAENKETKDYTVEDEVKDEEAEEDITENDVENKEAGDKSAETEVENNEIKNATSAGKEVVNNKAEDTIAGKEVGCKEAEDTIAGKEVENKEAADTIAEGEVENTEAGDTLTEKEVENKEAGDYTAEKEVENKDAEDAIAVKEGESKEREDITAENEVANNEGEHTMAENEVKNQEVDIQLTKSDPAIKESGEEDVEISDRIEERVSENCTLTEKSSEENESEFQVSESPLRDVKMEVFSEREEKDNVQENHLDSTEDKLDSEGHPENTDSKADNVWVN